MGHCFPVLTIVEPTMVITIVETTMVITTVEQTMVITLVFNNYGYNYS